MPVRSFYCLIHRREWNQPFGPRFPLSPPREEGFRDFAESLIDNIDEVFFWRDADTVKPHFVSHAYERIWGPIDYTGCRTIADTILRTRKARMENRLRQTQGQGPALPVKARA